MGFRGSPAPPVWHSGMCTTGVSGAVVTRIAPRRPACRALGCPDRVEGLSFVVVLLVILFVLCVLAAPAVGLLIHRRGAHSAGERRPSPFSPFTWGAAATARLGPILGPVACVLAGCVVTVAVILPLGFVAKHSQHAIDGPVFRWFAEHKSPGTFMKLNDTLTVMGDRGITELIVLVSLSVLVFAYGRRWWVPVVVIGAVFLLQRQFQIELTSWVGRYQPPVADNGGYPSGGVSRLIGDSGTIVAVSAALLPRLSRAWRIGLFTGVFTYGLTEGYTRVYLQVHWLTDAIGGLLFGAVMLATGTALLAALPPGRPLPGRDVQPARRTRAGRPGESRSTTRPATSATP